jgi:non-canonical purine NTP pyrophosphatase (RdgB/HAM1 family)
LSKYGLLFAKMKKILFATGNLRKVGEAKLGCEIFGVEVEQIKVSIDEIQSTDPIKISEYKASQAFKAVRKPVVVTDSFWEIPALNGFPGAYMKDIVGWFDSKDFLKLIKNKNDKRIAFTESITYKDSKTTKVFSKKYWGCIVSPPRGTGNSIDNIAEFDGVTLGERRAEGKYSHRPKDYIWYDFAKWYSKK